MSEAPRIWTRRPKIIEPRDLITFRPRLRGIWHKLEAIRPDGRRRHLAGPFPNLITDVGLDAPGVGTGWAARCVVGTGNATPDEGDTTLQAQVAATLTRQDNVSGSNQTADQYNYARTTFRFAAGAAEGNLAEIGVTRSGSGDPMLSRALILDGSGDPTTITVLADEVLDATYEIRCYPPLDDLVTTMDVSGDTHDIVLRASEVDSLWALFGSGLGATIGWLAGTATNGARVYPSTSVIGATTGSPTGVGSNNSSSGNSTYIPGTFNREFQYTWNLGSGNVSGGIAALRVTCGSRSSAAGEGTSGQAFQLSVDPVIPKNSGNNLVLNFRQAWARRTI